MIYFYDGSKESFLTAFVLSYGDGDATLTSRDCQLSLGQETVFVKADPARAAKAEARLNAIDSHCMRDLDLLLRSGEKQRDGVLLRYFRCLAAYGRPVRDMYQVDAAREADRALRKIGTEIHRMKGFVRFMECASGALYAPVSPDNDICDLLLPHFRGRLGSIPFVIHDVSRRKAAVFDGEHSFVAPLGGAEIVLSADEENWRDLWKRYYASVNIPSRERLKQMRGYMPVRYWRFMPEKR